eukprot:CAMPEP_0119560418 /NCGR_PEP_ID=MMETSP1352-20130426/14827_1 /TAXON_ID=265584 /ORGANISM="Stauroneis constricta, Strain CCMP1120" /LENGTH=757 /DNA_ID=CAMNT_0007608391 /DNA_START=91 /DNA_END=2364 /DNA_ORIENTATION=+
MANDNEEKERFTMDIRVFLAVITVAMAASFTLGVAMGPAQQDLYAASLLQQKELATGMAKDAASGVSSVQLDPPAAPTVDVDDDHEPAGQHLLVDIKGIEAAFLDSEERLSKAMVDAVQAAGLTMLSYHCHSLIPKGVSCVGVLLESHISFHTWPDEGVITLDLFTCGSNPLVPVVQTIKELFGIGENVQVQWSHELRGFRRGNKKDENFALLDHNSDLSQIVWSPFDCTVKEQVVSTLTKYQRVDVWDVVGVEESPSYEDAIKHNLQPGDPRWTTAELVTPDRMLFLDGVLQSDTDSFREYHEAMVQPAMFAHANPQHVAIVGGGEGASLREVLKHKTVQSATLIEIDEEFIDIVKTAIPAMSNCSDFEGRASVCFDDDVVTVVKEDAKQWFVDRYGANPTKEAPADKFDVVVMDAIEPEVARAISKNLYDDSSVLASIMKSLSDDGILAIQIGRAPAINDPRPDIGINAPREMLFKKLESLPEVEAMFVYEDAHAGFIEPRAFMVVCKNSSCRSRWYASSDVIDYEIYDRILRTKSNDRALVYFDGVTQLGYQVAPKAWETVYCRREPTPFECAYRHLPMDKKLFEYNIANEDEGDFKLSAKWSDDNEEIIETYVHANVDIPAGSFIMPSHLASSLVLSDETLKGLRGNLEYGGVTVIEDFVEYIDEFGHKSKAEGSGQNIVEIGASYLIRSVSGEASGEANIGRWIPAHPDGKRPKYSPVYERHRLSFDVFMVATKDIPKGAEIVRNAEMWEVA